MQAILPFLATQVPAHIAAWAIAKKSPKLAAFIHASQASGHSADSIMNYLRNKLKTEGSIAHESELSQRASQGTARPDEMAALQQIKSSQLPVDLLQKGVASGLGALTGLGVNRMMGEEEGEQDQGRMDQGKFPVVPPMQEEQIEPSSQQTKQIPVGTLEALSPKLKAFVEERLSAGNPLNRIALLAKSHFFDEINQIQNESGMQFRDFLERLYGQERKTARVLGLQQEQNSGKQNLANSIMQAVEMMRQMRGQ